MARRLHWDLFCKVVDNFGDAGVALRLARCLTRDYDQSVRLIVDKLDTLKLLWPEISTSPEPQTVQGIRVQGWEGVEQTVCGEVLVELFGCGLPHALAARQALSPKPALWLNVEHLSAEPWVESHHLLKSPQPGGIFSTYFYPGFTSGTGGLLRERGLLSARARFTARSALRRITLGALGLHEPAAHGLVVLVFCYPQPELEAWMQTLAQSPIPVTLLLPPGAAREAACEWLSAILPPRSSMARGSVTVCALPMLPQQRFDELLWCADVAVVRGEDSFMRAQWAGLPFIWHAYPQHDDAHMKKVNAFLDLYLRGLEPAAAASLRTLWLAWNEGAPLTQAWLDFLMHGDALHAHAQFWAARQATQPSLARKLMSLAQPRLHG